MNANAGISLAESVLIHVINGSKNGCSQDVFQAPEKVLGPHCRLWTAFGRHIDQMSKEDWERVAAAAAAAAPTAWVAAREAEWEAAAAVLRDAAAWDASREAAAAAVWEATWGTTAWEAAWAEAGAAARAAACHASDEIIGWSKLEEPFFLKMFFDDPKAWAKSIEDAIVKDD